MSRAVFVLLLLAFAGAVPAQEDPRLRELLLKLDDDSIEVRAAAATALAKLAKEAVPALRRAAADAGTETRDRLLEIIRRIEDRERLSALLPAPSLITIEAKDRPLKEVFQSLVKQTRTPIDLTGIPEDARVTVSLQRVPFWIALEEICRASGRVMADADADHVVVTAEPYVRLPGRTTDLFRVALRQLDLSSTGTFGQPDRFDSFTASFVVSWERGARPWRVSAHLMELLDEKGDDLSVPGDENDEPPSSIAPDAIVKDVPISSRRGPGPQAMKITGMKVEFHLEFPLRIAELRLDVAEGRIPAAAESAEFGVQLSRLGRVEGSLQGTLAMTQGGMPPDLELTSDAIVLRDKKGGDHPAIIIEGPEVRETETTYLVSFPDAPDVAQLKDLVIRIPVEVHRERIEVDLKEIPLK